MKDKILTKMNLKTIVLIIAILVIGISFAYLIAQLASGAQSNIDINSGTTDQLRFSVSKDLSISANQDNFGIGKESISDSAVATATLLANSENSSTYNYYLYLDIIKNDFVYSTEIPYELISVSRNNDNYKATLLNESYKNDININKLSIPNVDVEPEILMIVKDPNNQELTSIEGLYYITASDGTTGFDITTKQGVIKIVDNYEITSSSSKTATEQNWTIEIVFINLPTNQEKNANTVLNGKVRIQKERIAENLSEVCTSGDNLSNCMTTLGELKNNSSQIIKHDDSIEYGAHDNSYRYSGGDYKIADVYLEQYDKISSIIIFNCDEPYTNGSTYCYNDTENNLQYYTLVYDAEKVKYYNYMEAIKKAREDGYIEYNVNNYVCFGSDAGTCPEENLYRIIGMFDSSIKLIKSDYATSSLLGTDGDYFENNKYYWNYKSDTIINNGRGSKVWETSLLNKTNLNTNFLANIGMPWNDMIASKDYITNSISYYDIDYTPLHLLYEIEIIKSTKTYNAKVGLMYISDYYYSTNLEYWTYPKYWYNDNNEIESIYLNISVFNNWLYQGYNEWTITVDNYIYSTTINIIKENSKVDENGSSKPVYVRPTFYLNTNVKYLSGTGSYSDPYRIGV